MKSKITYLKKPGGLTKLLFFLAIFLVSAQTQTWAQTKILADEVTYTSGDDKMISLLGCGTLGLGACYDPTVENPNNAVANDNNYARLLASPGLALNLVSYKGVIELKFAQTLPADTWSYVRMEGDSELFKALLGGSLGNLLGDVLEYVLIGNQEVIIDARMGGTTVLSRSSTQGFGTDRVKLIQDGDGNNYLAIRPASDYDRLRITNQTGSLLGLGIEKTLDIYNAFYYEDIGNDCDRPFATSFDGGGGIGLEVVDLNDQNLGNAIDNNPDNTYSQVKSSSVLDVDVASTLSQYFYFPTVSAETTTANIKLALGSGGLVNTDLLGAIEIIFFEDNTIVSRRSLQSSLLNNTNALTLLDSGEPVTLTFAPGKAFNRIAIKLNSPVGVNLLGNGVKIYDVQRYDDIAGCSNPLIAALPTATADPFETASCASGLIDFDNVDFAHRAVDGNNESYATLFADAGDLLVSGPTAGFIEMDLGQTVPANKTTYVRINYDEDVLDRLVGGSLGKLVGDLANDLLLGNQYFEVEAKNGNSSVLKEKSSDAFEGTADGVVTLVQDDIGRFYIAITPDSDYDRIRITNHVTAVLSTGKKASLDVYNACFEIGVDNCFPANFTSYRGGGVNLSAGDISNVGVENPYRAISDNSSEYSKINLGIAGIAANVYQTIYFNKPSQANDKVKIRLQMEPSSALSVDLLGAYNIKFFNGNTEVEDYSLQDGLINNIDLLTLFRSGGIAELEFEPSSTFDRVDIGAESIVSLNVAAEPLRVYSVERYGDTCPLQIGESPFESPTCAVELIDAQNADDIQNLFDGDFDSFATLNSGAGVLLGLGNKHEGFVELGYDHDVPAGTTSYIRIDFEDGVLDKLVGGSLGNIVSGLLDGLILGDHFFEVDVKHNGTSVDSASSQMDAASAGGNNAIRVVRDKQGRYYIAVTPDQAYNSVRITDKTNSALGLLAEPNTMNVYGMCYENSADKCLEAFATSYEYSGLNLSVNDLGGAGVTNPQYAINGNTTNYSEISNGTLGVVASTKQWIYFNSVSGENDIATIQFKTQGGVVDADILGGLEIKAYLANDEVYSVSSENGLINGINVAQLLTNGEMVTLDISPGQSFDRISVGIKTLVEVGVFPPIHLYSVDRVCVSNAYAKDDINQVPQDEPVSGNVLTNDEGENLTVTSLDYYDDQGDLQTLELNNASATTIVYTEGPNPIEAGEIEIQPDGSYTFTPEDGFVGKVPLGYTMTDGENNVDQAQLSIKVLPVLSNGAHAPVAQNDVVSTIEGIELTNNVLTNDSDPKGETITVTSFGQEGDIDNAVGSSIVVAGENNNGNPVTNAGTFTLATDGTYTFTPTPGFLGKVDPIIYIIENEQYESDTAHVSVRVLPAAENTTFVNDDAITGQKAETLNGNVLDNDFDPEGNNQSVTSIIVDGDAHTIDPNSSTTVEIPGKGTLVVNSDGNFTWTPVAEFVGTVTVGYTACDGGSPLACDEATLYLTNLEIPCTVPGATGTPGVTHIGISTLDRNVEEWLTDENQNKLGAYIALESTNKAFIITRNADPANNITYPVEGMVVWDTTENCLKLYKGDSLGWECTTNQCNQ